MIKYIYLIIGTILTFAVFTGNAYAPNDTDIIDDLIKEISDPKPSHNNSKRFKVYVEVDCEDDITKNSIESYIKRELRSLQDVEIVVKENAKLFLRCMAIVETTKSGQKTGYIIIAYNILSKYPTGILASVLTKENYRLLSDPKSIWKLPNLYFEPLLGLISGYFTNIDEICKGIVVRFDVNQLEPQRKYEQKMGIK